MLNLDEHQKQALRTSWAQVAIDPSFAARLFYGRLFQQRPELRAMFGDDMELQGRKLMDTLNFVIDHLDRSERLAEPVRELGVRHQEYGVVPKDYGDVGNALLWAFQNILQGEFRSDVESAWTAAYFQISEAMIEAEA
ncbi:MAG: globin domain-containing protein [Pseudomonadota bacterium]